jgi:hypothetical protein
MEEALSIIFVIIFRKLAGSNQRSTACPEPVLRYFYRTEKNPVNFPSPEAEICTHMIIICGADMWYCVGWKLRWITG